jgi:hypothetical protein
MLEEWILRLHLLVSLYMLGLIWFVQVVHYPLMGKVGRSVFVDYEHAHTRLTSWVTAPIMLVELSTGMLLLYWKADALFWWGNAIGIGLLWASTFFIQVPLHAALSKQFDETKHRQLVRTNWIRTVVWTIRAVALIITCT